MKPRIYKFAGHWRLCIYTKHSRQKVVDFFHTLDDALGTLRVYYMYQLLDYSPQVDHDQPR